MAVYNEVSPVEAKTTHLGSVLGSSLFLLSLCEDLLRLRYLMTLYQLHRA